jgi:hypothetical protein
MRKMVIGSSTPAGAVPAHGAQGTGVQRFQRGRSPDLGVLHSVWCASWHSASCFAVSNCRALKDGAFVAPSVVAQCILMRLNQETRGREKTCR